ncbi:Bacterial Ig-like domain (group 2) [compost metagenome]
MTLSLIHISETAASLYLPAQDGTSLPGLPHQLRLTATVTMSDDSSTRDVTWTSANEAIAQVDGAGYVVARGVGTTEIVATSAQDAAKTARCVVTVTAKGLVDVELE